jgi:cytochrome P450
MRLRTRLERGGTVDIADTARVWVGRMVADLLGLPDAGSEDDAPFRRIFAQGERLAALALGTIGSTEVKPELIAEGRRIVERLTAGVPRAYEQADAGTLLGRCREAGIPQREARGLASVLLVAGTETSAAAMARGVALLYDTGQQQALLADRALLPGAVREILRVTTPAPLIGRHITGEFRAGRRTMQRGDRVLMLTYTSNNAAGGFDIRSPLDPTVFQLWFGAGQHRCLGAPLARAEIAYLLETLLAQGRPWRIVLRRAARRVIVPSYAALVVGQ